MYRTLLALAALVLIQYTVCVRGWVSRPKTQPAITTMDCGEPTFGKRAMFLCRDSPAKKRVLSTRADVAKNIGIPEWIQKLLDTRQVDWTTQNFALGGRLPKKQIQSPPFPTLSYFYNTFPENGGEGNLWGYLRRQVQNMDESQAMYRKRRSSAETPDDAENNDLSADALD